MTNPQGRPPEPCESSQHPRGRLVGFFLLEAALAVAFAVPFWRFVYAAPDAAAQSYVLLIPFVSLYLVRSSRRNPVIKGTPSILPALIVAVLGMLLCSVALAGTNFPAITTSDRLTCLALSFLAFCFSASLATLGWQTLRPFRFALLFLLFAVPLPFRCVDFFSKALQHGSAEAAVLTLHLTGMPVLREGLSFEMPGLRILVAEECSGFRSTFVLFITSILASHLFLRTGWKKAVLVLSVFPLGILRNAFRITVISWLTVNVDRRVIDSPLHHRGGPVFFALSLIPLFGLLLWLLKTDSKKSKLQQKIS